MTRALATYDTEAKLGPAMAALNPNMQQFALAILQTGCSQARAAELAGYTGDRETLKATGWRLAHDQRVQAAIHEEAQKLIRSTSVMAINVITEIAQSPYLASAMSSALARLSGVAQWKTKTRSTSGGGP